MGQSFLRALVHSPTPGLNNRCCSCVALIGLVRRLSKGGRRRATCVIGMLRLDLPELASHSIAVLPALGGLVGVVSRLWAWGFLRGFACGFLSGFLGGFPCGFLTCLISKWIFGNGPARWKVNLGMDFQMDLFW